MIFFIMKVVHHANIYLLHTKAYIYTALYWILTTYKLMLLPESLCVSWQLHMFFFFPLYKFPFPNKVWKVSQRV